MQGEETSQPSTSQEVSNIENAGGDNEEDVKGCVNLFCHPRGQAHRFIALFFMCFLGFGSYFCYDNPAALEDKMRADLNIDESQITMMYSVYSWPNVILCFIGGFLIDKVFGIRLGANIFMGITLLGQLVFASGAYFNQYWLILVGRFIFGIGGESLAVAQNNYAVLWFKGKELNMVFGLQLSLARVGSTVNFLVMESIYEWVHKQFTGPQGIGIVLFIALATCILSQLCALILGFFDKRAERILNRTPLNESTDEVHLKDILDFKLSFWMVTIICVTFYVAIFPFMSLAKDFFIKEYGMSGDAANNVCSIVYMISGVASPLMGLVIDKTGKNVFWIIGAIVATIAAHMILAFCSFTPYVGMSLLGLSYSLLASSLWPLVSLLIPEYQLGTAYGVCQAIQNLGLAVISIVTGLIVKHFNYTVLEIFFILNLALALFSAGILWLIDFRQKGMLNLTPAARNRHASTQLAPTQEIDKNKLIASTSSLNDSTDDLVLPTDQVRNRSPSSSSLPKYEGEDGAYDNKINMVD